MQPQAASRISAALGREAETAPLVRAGLNELAQRSISFYMEIDRQKVKRMSAIATVSSKFQISIPKEVREQMALRPGEKVAFIAKLEGLPDCSGAQARRLGGDGPRS